MRHGPLVVRPRMEKAMWIWLFRMLRNCTSSRYAINKARMVRLLNRYIDGPGLTIVIGAEHAAPDLRLFSLIASTEVDGSAIRTIGVTPSCARSACRSACSTLSSGVAS